MKLATTLTILFMVICFTASSQTINQTINQTVTPVSDPQLGDGIRVDITSTNPSIHLYVVNMVLQHGEGMVDIRRVMDFRNPSLTTTVYFWFGMGKPVSAASVKVLTVFTFGYQAVDTSLGR